MVPDSFKNLINPWQTESEIRAQVKFLHRMFLKLRLSQEEFVK
jgi:hypothetical protein